MLSGYDFTTRRNRGIFNPKNRKRGFGSFPPGPSGLLLDVPLTISVASRFGPSAESFARAQTATYIDPVDGLLKAAAINAPRFESVLGSNALLLEGADANLYLYSNTFTNGVWAKGANITWTADNAVSPDGLTNATRYSISSTTGRTFAQSITTNPAGRTFTASMWVNTVAGTTISFQWMRDSTQLAADQFTPTPGVWTRISSKYTYGGTAGTTMKVNIYDGGGSTGSRMWVYGAHLSENKLLMSYIPTVETSLTRSAESLSWSIAKLYGGFPRNGTLTFKWIPGYSRSVVSAANRSLVSLDGSANSLCYHYNTAFIQSYDGAHTGTVALDFSADTLYQVFVRWSTDRGKMKVSFYSGGTFTHGTEVAYSPYALGTYLSLFTGNINRSWFRNLKFFGKSFSDSELVSLV